MSATRSNQDKAVYTNNNQDYYNSNLHLQIYIYFLILPYNNTEDFINDSFWIIRKYNVLLGTAFKN